MLRLGQILAFAMRTIVSPSGAIVVLDYEVYMSLVLYKQVKSAARAVRPAMGAAHRHRPRLGAQQVGGFAPESP